MGESLRGWIASGPTYLGAQRSGAIFWTSDVQSTWEALRRQVHANLNMAARGIDYTSSDTGGRQWPDGPAPQWPILADYLRLRYRLMPYLYTLGNQTWRSGAPFMRALFMDFPNDRKVATVGDEYMSGPAFLVAPVLEQGATKRRVHLPAGTDWYDWWTNRRYTGRRWIEAEAPIERIPLFVRAGSIIPLGAAVPNTRRLLPGLHQLRARTIREPWMQSSVEKLRQLCRASRLNGTFTR